MSSSDASSSPSSSSPGSAKRGVKRKREPDAAILANPRAKKATPQKVTRDGDSDSSDSDSDDSDSNNENEDEETQEAEVLSHAAQRKLKKKAKKEARVPQPSSVTQTEAGDTPHKRQNSIWVGNLAFKTTAEALRAFFQRHIPSCEVTRVHLPTKTGKDVAGGRGMRGENRGFAYIDFMAKEDKEKAIALSEQNLDGRKLLIKDGGDFTGRPTAVTTVEGGAATGNLISAVGKSKTAQRILAAQKQPSAPTLFLGNLGFQATEQSIRAMIEGHMKTRRKDNLKEIEDTKETVEAVNDSKWLRKVRMGTFEDSGLCKGFAFIDFGSIEDATNVLLDPRNHHLDGRKLVVEYASADAVRRGGGPGAKALREKNEANEKGGARRVGKPTRDEPKSGYRANWESARQGPGDEVGPPLKRLREADEKHEERRGKAKRTKPGAALALAQREKVAIVPSSGKKIVF